MRNSLEKISQGGSQYRSLYIKFAIFLTLSLLITTAGTYVGSLIKIEPSKPVIWGYMIASIALVVLFKMTEGLLKRLMFTLFCFGEGVILSLIVGIVTPTALYGGLFATTMIVLAFSIIGMHVKRLDWLGGILFGSLISFLGLAILSVFVHLPFLSYLGLGLFSVFVMYDVNKFKNDVLDGVCNSADGVIDNVMELYLDMINIFTFIIRIGSDD